MKKKKVKKSRKARKRCLPHAHDFVHQAPVWLRRKMGFWGADWRQFNEAHGLIGLSPVNPIII